MQKRNRSDYLTFTYKQKRIPNKGSSDYLKRMIAYKMAERDLKRLVINESLTTTHFLFISTH